MKEVIRMYDPAHARGQPTLLPTPLFVEQSGAGTPLLLIHGLMVSGAMYQPVLPALVTHYRLIVPDLRGHGRSGALGGPYSVEQLARDLAQLLDDLQIDAAHVLGYSQGGAVAQQFAHDYPKRVRGLVLGCTYAYNMLSRRERLEGMLAPWFVRILGMRRVARLLFSGVGGGERLPPETARWLQEILAANDKTRMVAAVEAMKAFDSRPWLHQITCPTLVIAGAEDTAVPLAHADMLAQGIPGAQLRVVDGAGHTLIWTHTDIFVQAVQAFLTSVNRA
jgi:pimeloyl-ACP methyl ester carboxylesterase